MDVREVPGVGAKTANWLVPDHGFTIG